MSQLANFVWSIADQLRGAYKPHEYGDVILPMTILRRLDCVLEESKTQVLAKAAKLKNPDHLALVLRNELGLPFYNTSKYTLKALLSEPDNLRANLVDYLAGFSANVADVFERFKFETELFRLEEKDRLFIVVRRFTEVDFHPDTLPNAAMGDLFEELIRKFAAASNETAGAHFTPRDAIKLMVELLVEPDDQVLQAPGIVRSVYDPTAGTGGMLSMMDEHVRAMNPEARLVLYGQEFNDQSYAICKADLIAKGQDAGNIGLDDTLANDLFAGKHFDYGISNPPMGVDWKASEKKVKEERQRDGAASRFGAGLPDIGDGQFLFVQHLVSKLRRASDGGGRAAIVLNASPLYSGEADSGSSEVRRWLLENDLVDAIVALPTNMFYNTDLATFIWLLDNKKPSERQGQLLLIDATSFFTRMPRNLGKKTRELSELDIKSILSLYAENTDSELSRVLTPDAFGYWKITVERPLRMNFECSSERIASLAGTPLDVQDLDVALASFGQERCFDRAAFVAALGEHLQQQAGLKLKAPQWKHLLACLGERDPSAEPCLDAKGNPEPDATLRDTEVVRFGPRGKAGKDEDIQAFFESKVLPHRGDAWIDHGKTKLGYEIPFSAIFYKPVVARPLAEIDADMERIIDELRGLLAEVEASEG